MARFKFRFTSIAERLRFKLNWRSVHSHYVALDEDVFPSGNFNVDGTLVHFSFIFTLTSDYGFINDFSFWTIERKILGESIKDAKVGVTFFQRITFCFINKLWTLCQFGSDAVFTKRLLIDRLNYVNLP